MTQIKFTFMFYKTPHHNQNREIIILQISLIILTSRIMDHYSTQDAQKGCLMQDIYVQHSIS